MTRVPGVPRLMRGVGAPLRALVACCTASAFAVLQVIVRALVRDPGPGPASAYVCEAGLELAGARPRRRPRAGVPEQVADGDGAAPRGTDRGASEAARERRAFGPVAASQFDALEDAVGAQLADRHTARRGRSGASGGVRLGPHGLVGSPFPSAALDPLVFDRPLTRYLTACRSSNCVHCARCSPVEPAGERGRFECPCRRRPRVQPRGGRAGLVARHGARAAAALEAPGTTRPPWPCSYGSAQWLSRCVAPLSRLMARPVSGTTRLPARARAGSRSGRRRPRSGGGRDRGCRARRRRTTAPAAFGGASAPSAQLSTMCVFGSSACARRRRCRPWSSAPAR